MDVDVVVVTFESAEHLGACIEPLLDRANFAIIDNASSDLSAEIGRRSGASVIENEENVGFARAANQGAALGTAPFILFLNPDASISAADLDRLVSALSGDPSTAVVGPRLFAPSGSEQRSWWPFPSARRSWIETMGLHRLRPIAQGPGGEVPFVVGACILVRREAFEAVGGFDERFWLYGEEADLAYRLRTLGWKSRIVSDARCTHEGGASGLFVPLRAFEEFCLGTDRFIAKHGGRGALLSHRIALLLGSLLRIAVTRYVDSTAERADLRRRIAVRSFHTLARSPTSVKWAACDTTPERGLVVCSLEAWDETWRRNQFLVRELMRAEPGTQVLFVEPPADVVHGWLTRRRLETGRGLRQGPLPGLWLYQPTKLLPRLINPTTDFRLRRQVLESASTLKFVAPTLWLNDTVYAELGEKQGWPMLYDVTDDWLAAASSRRELRRRRRRESLATRRARVVVCCSDELAARRQAIDLRVIRNGLDVEHFTRPQPRPDDLPDGPSLVYVGTLHEDRLDVDLVEELAMAVPNANVVLVGPVALARESHARLERTPNVHILGPRPYVNVPAYIQHADVLVVPHVVTEFTESLDPIKAYECCAVGVSTVSTQVSGFRDLGENVQAVSRERFVAAVQGVLAAPAAPRPRAVATWADRAVAFRQALRDTRTSERRLKVVYLDHCAKLSGGELALLRLLPALEVDPHVILAEDGPLVDRLRQEGISTEIIALSERTAHLSRDRVTVLRLPIRAAWDTAVYGFRIYRRLREIKPDLVHTNSLKSAIYGGIAGRAAGVPTLVHLRDRLAPDYLPRQAIAVIRTFLRIVPAAVVANSETTLSTLHEHRGRGSVVPSPVVHDPVYITAADQPDLGPAFVVGMIGRIAPWKGQDTFLRAFAEAFPEGDELARVIGAALFGEDAFGSNLRSLASDLGVSDRVEFTGFREDIGAELAQINVLVHASVIPEPFGQVVVEGMAAGVPVIASAEGGPAEIIDDGVSGLLVPPGDTHALAELLRLVRADRELRDRLSKGGLEAAAAFKPDIVAAKLLGAYRAVVPGSHPTPRDI